MPKISIIVPVYKAERYLHRCVDSILAQTFTDFEVLLIDDGSPDNSGKICDEYAIKDARVKVIHKQNGGVSSARNLGIKIALGEWIFFLDADDWVDATLFENYLNQSCADLIISGFTEFGCSNKKFEVRDNLIFNVASQNLLSLNSENMPIKKLLLYCWGKFFKRSIILDNNISFNENIKLSEDAIFVIEYLNYTNTINLISANNVHYYVPDKQGKYKMTLQEYKNHIKTLSVCLLKANKQIDKSFYENYEYLFLMFFSNFQEYLKKLKKYNQIKFELNQFANIKEFNVPFYYIKKGDVFRSCCYYLLLNIPILYYLLKK